MKNGHDLTGKHFGRLTVVGPAPNTDSGRCAWWCRCRCGTKKIIIRTNLTSGTTRSCGCLRRENLAALASIHHKSQSRVYWIWKGLVHRKRHHACPVCPEWETFLTFYNDLGEPRPSQFLCRLDPNEPYCIWNCYWGSKLERFNPKKLQKWYKYHTKWITLPTICIIENRQHDYHTIYTRLWRGDSLEHALRHRTSKKVVGKRVRTLA
jgi:hypothetical protein